MSVSLIWAEARGGVIGDGGGIPWHVPEDLAHFREVTTGGTVLMGRRTWDSLPERFRPLPGRQNLVLTRDPGWSSRGAEVVHSLDEVLPRFTAPDAPLWVIGGGELYRQSISHAARLEVTEVDLDVAGDTVAPRPGDSWQSTATAWAISRTGIRYRFVTHTHAHSR
ncbi:MULTISPECIES: dihydrofolate reductase [Subtercola]|uniref:Dihydrofolate reductase n=1 Tax=Subtercola vilae TaxID=2056433 RepID=A0A4T2C7K5_9MICO|nr:MULTISPECIES: dihydrofolate reductase [Subtercola]MEA9985441.1 dihydrofolate reductase [Subtercola sp. RTI3]TIH39331.1 dihydrofolate reductase [Subtercola vilae]